MSFCGSTELSQKLAVSWVTLTWGFSLVLSQRDTWEWPQSAGLLLPAVFQRSGGWHPFFLSITSRVLDLFFFSFWKLMTLQQLQKQNQDIIVC